MEINENTITLAIDLQGGMCDRLMLGKQGIINNANASLESWKFSAPDDEDIQNMQEITTLENAIAILNTDNFSIHIVNSVKDICRLLGDNFPELDFNNIPFNNNIYRVY